MASFFVKALEKLVGKQEKRVLIMGLDYSGKTTILYKLKLGTVVTTIPTIGFNVETVEYKNISFTVWDVGGKDKIRPLWRHYYAGTEAIIFVIDSNDRQRLISPDGNDETNIGYDYSSANGLMHTLLQELELRECVWLFYANKQDLPNALTVYEIKKRLNLNKILRDRLWHIVPACATTGDGLYEGLDWLTNILTKHASDIQKLIQQRELRITNKTKSILLISGYIRQVDTKYKFLTSLIPFGVAKLIHFFYQDPNEFFINKYKFYNEYNKHDEPEFLFENINVEKPELLILFLKRQYNDIEYIKNDDEFIDKIKYSLSGKLPLNNLYSGKLLHKFWYLHYDLMRMIWVLFTKYGRRNGLKQIWKYTPYNTSETYFWAQLIYFGIYNHSNENTLKLIQTDFRYFMMLNPCFCANFQDLIKKYYSTKLLSKIKNEKTNEMVLPDLQKLPSIITDINTLKQEQNTNKIQINEGNQMRYDNDDQKFIISFENRSFKSWGHQCFLRVIWCYVDRFDGGKKCVNKIMTELKIFQKDSYHETKTYFWIHQMRYWRALFKEYVVKKKNKEWNFNAFKKFCESQKKNKMLNDEWWKEYYDENVMNNKGFHDIDASKQMVFPNKKQLPQLKLVTK
eukprot:139077_1